MSSNHLNRKRDVCERTSTMGFVTKAGSETVSKLSIILYGVHDDGEEKEVNISP
jgi:hypothetical protein